MTATNKKETLKKIAKARLWRNHWTLKIHNLLKIPLNLQRSLYILIIDKKLIYNTKSINRSFPQRRQMSALVYYVRILAYFDATANRIIAHVMSYQSGRQTQIKRGWGRIMTIRGEWSTRFFLMLLISWVFAAPFTNATKYKKLNKQKNNGQFVKWFR